MIKVATGEQVWIALIDLNDVAKLQSAKKSCQSASWRVRPTAVPEDTKQNDLNGKAPTLEHEPILTARTLLEAWSGG
jgi:hypothetical protein